MFQQLRNSPLRDFPYPWYRPADRRHRTGRDAVSCQFPSNYSVSQYRFSETHREVLLAASRIRELWGMAGKSGGSLQTA